MKKDIKLNVFSGTVGTVLGTGVGYSLNSGDCFTIAAVGVCGCAIGALTFHIIHQNKKIKKLKSENRYVTTDSNRDLSQLETFKNWVNPSSSINTANNGGVYYTTDTNQTTSTRTESSTSYYTETTTEETSNRAEAISKVGEEAVSKAEAEVDKQIEKEMDERAIDLLKDFDLDKEANVIADNLPYGKQRKLEIARALATSPKVLLLDEPAAGMNPTETLELMDTIRNIRDKFHIAILLIEHDMNLVLGICEELVVLDYGRVIAQGLPLDVVNDPTVITAYIGDW